MDCSRARVLLDKGSLLGKKKKIEIDERAEVVEHGMCAGQEGLVA